MPTYTSKMATYNSGQVQSGTPGTSHTDFHSRRLFDFSDRVGELSPDESPFFVYLSKVGKVPTTDSQFRFLEDRTKVSITDRAYLLFEGKILKAGSPEELAEDEMVRKVYLGQNFELRKKKLSF